MATARQSIALLLLSALSGCGLFESPINCNPGPTSYQVNQAKRFDPYPDPTTGPTIVGGRPLDFMEPRPEPDVTKNPRMWLPPGTAAPAALGYPPATYPAAAPPAVYPAAPPAGSYVVPSPVAPATSYIPAAAPASRVVMASATTPIPVVPTATSAVPGASTAATAPIAYGTKIDGP